MGRWRKPASVAGLAMFVLSVLPCESRAAIEDFVNQPIGSVQLVQDGRPIDEPVVLELVQTRVGQPLTIVDVRQTLTHLYGLGRFQDIRVIAARGERGVALTYELVPRQTVDRLVFRGPLGLSQDRLRRAIVDRFGASPNPGRVREMADSLTSLYRDYGYQHSVVHVRVEAEQPEHSMLVFEIDSGPRATISTVDIEGRPLLTRATLLDRLYVAPGEPYDRPEILAGIERVTDDLRERGYYEARVDHKALFTIDGRSVDLIVSVEPGPHFEVAFQGDPLPSRQRSELVPVRREGSVDQDLLEDSKRSIEEYLFGQGYRDATADLARTGDEQEQRVVVSIKRGRRYEISDISFEGNQTITSGEIAEIVDVERGDPWVRSTLENAAARVAEEYRRRGFVAATVKTDSVTATDPAATDGGDSVPVSVRITLVEGVRTVVGTINFTGNIALSADILQSALTLRPGEPYYAPRLSTDLDAVVLHYLNRGYQSATADAKVDFSEDRTRADLTFAIVEGPQVFVDHILIVGNTRTRAETIQRELAVRSGQPLSFTDIVESQRRLSALGLFRRVRITELRHPGAETSRDLLVTVEEAPLTTIGYGVGLEGGRRLRRTEEEEGAVEVFEFAPRGFFEVGRRNLWGKNRSVNLFTRVSFRAHETIPAESDPGQPAPTTPETTYGFNEYRVLGTFREPRVFGTAADALITVYLEQAIRSSFNFNRRGVRAEAARRVGGTLSVVGRYEIDRTRLFDEQINPADRPDIDRLFPRVRISSFSASLLHDTRDDALDPIRGRLVGIDGELAGRAIGSEVGFAKTFLQGFIYRRVPGTERVVFVGGARLALGAGFPREVTETDEDGNPVLDPDGNPVVEEVSDLPASERFFAGGDTTVRGFAQDRLGRPDTFDSDGFPTGGHALVIFNAELRVPVWRELGAVAFLDSGNVFRVVDDLNLGHIRGGAGFGIRYRSPIGPLRIDLGFKFNRERFANGAIEPRTALHISLGQAF
jgi:outer membrane protein assembly complex protein YaeT